MQQWPAIVVTVLGLASCTSATPCTERHPVPADCPDLRIGARGYDEWRAITKPPLMQEIDVAVYPACNIPEACGGDDLFGLGATDVWRLEGVDPDKAVIALRQGTNRYAIFVERRTDPTSLIWRPHLQETKRSQSGQVNVRYRHGWKGRWVGQLTDLIDETMPYRRVRYAF